MPRKPPPFPRELKELWLELRRLRLKRPPEELVVDWGGGVGSRLENMLFFLVGEELSRLWRLEVEAEVVSTLGELDLKRGMFVRRAGYVF